MVRRSRNGNLYYFNFKNLSITIKAKNGLNKVIFVGEKVHESGVVFTVEDFCRMFLRLEA